MHFVSVVPEHAQPCQGFLVWGRISRDILGLLSYRRWMAP
jgi:hypothetical protein